MEVPLDGVVGDAEALQGGGHDDLAGPRECRPRPSARYPGRPLGRRRKRFRRPPCRSARRTAFISSASSRVLPLAYSGCARNAFSTRASRVPGAAAANSPNERARPDRREREDRRTAAVDRDVRGLLAGGVLDRGPDLLLQWVIRRPVVVRVCQLVDVRQVRIIAACLPEQFIVIGSAAVPRAYPGVPRRSSDRVLHGRAQGRLVQTGLREDPRVRRPGGTARPSATHPRARAARRPGRRPLRSMPSACIGLFDERGNIGWSTMPADQATVPSGLVTTTEPR